MDERKSAYVSTPRVFVSGYGEQGKDKGKRIQFIKKTKLSILTVSLFFGLTSNVWGLANDGTYNGNNYTASGDFIASATCDSVTKTIATYNEEIYIDDPTTTEQSCILTISADGTNTASFQLTGIGLQEYSITNSYSNVKVEGILASGGTVTQTNSPLSTTNGGSRAIWDESDLGLGNFSNKDLSSFKLYLTTSDNSAPNSLSITGFTITDAQAPSSNNSDATLTASATITEPIALATTADTSAEAVNLFDFTITDGGGGDGLSTDVTQIVLNTSGTADFSKVTWKLNGANASGVVGAYDSVANTLTFSSLSISVADSGDETYTLTGYYNNPTGLTDNQTYIFSVDGDTDLSLDGAKTQMGSTTAVTNGTGTKVDVTATRLIFTTQPSN